MIYLDNHATTQCDPRVLEAMWPWFAQDYGNAHSVEHAAGRRASDAVETARAEVAALIGAAANEIVFTSGATEANNLAIKGAARFAGVGVDVGVGGGVGGRGRVVTSSIEHKCVLESVGDLAAEGFEKLVLPVQPDGIVPVAALNAALETPTLLVSVIAANNEVGVVQDIAALAEAAHAAGARFHTDIAQAAGRIPIDVRRQDIDLASLSAHKLYGPKGVGALYVRRHPRMRLAPLFSGGGQERGLRSGTLPVPLIVGFGVACRIALADMAAEQARILALRDRLLEGLRAQVPGLAVNGGMRQRLAGNLSLRFPGLDATALIAACGELALSTGSACTSAAVAPSHVLTAMGLSPAEAGATLRVGIGRFTSAADIDAAVRILAREALRVAASNTLHPTLSAEA
jgi:cysteine desulfurase